MSLPPHEESLSAVPILEQGCACARRKEISARPWSYSLEAEEGGEYRKETYADEVYAVKSTAFADVSPGETFQLWVYNLHNERHPFADVSPGETFSSLGVIE